MFLFYFLMMMVGIPVLFNLIETLFGLDFAKLVGQNVAIISLSLVVNTLTCLYVFYIIRAGYNLPLRSVGLTIDNWKTDVWLGLKHYIVILPVIIFVSYAVNFISELFGISPDNQEIITKLLQEESVPVLVFMVFFGTLAAPIVEEILFRGFLQPVIRPTVGKTKTIIISGGLFALVHLNAHVFFQIFILGLLLAYLFELTKSLIAPMTVHLLHNSITFVFLLSYKQFLKGHV
ncbi:MAG: CAAX amino protease [Candidatus Scalindua sp.]|nr:CPBP family intramembrane metalloprotease [Planctomycetota bacterium]GJQ59874.1 MAG: CAAX amino protease [Candidatus Scalindua sp.]